MVRAAGTPDLVSRGLLEKGEILEKELNQRDSAIAHYRKAVEVKPDYLMGWRSLASALKLDKKWQDAAIAFQKIIDLEPNPKNKIEDIYGLGIIYRDGFGDLNRARESFEKALSLDKMHVPSMEAILSIYLKSKQWEKYIELSQRFISLIPKTEEKKAALLHYQRGQVLRDFLNDRQKAVAEFQSAIRLDPDNIPARVELAELYAKETNSYPLAIREHQEIISRDLFRLQSYHQMGMLYELLGKLDEAFCCYKVLQLFKTANRDETMFLEANEAQVTRSSNKTLGDDMQYRLLSHPDCRGPLLEIIAEIGDYLADVLPPQLEKTGANKSNKVPANSTVGYKKLVDELALNLGISAYDLYMVPQQTEPRVVATEPPSLVINADWLNHLRETERRFILGKYLLHLKLRHGIIFNNQLAEVFRAVMLFVWLVVPEVRVPGVAESDLEKMAKPIKRAVPRKVRAALEEKAKILAREGLPKAPAEWLRGVHLTGHFAGMLLANDLMESLSAVLRLDNRYKNVNLKDLGDPRSVLEQSEDAKELLRFWVSETFFTLRKRAGFSLLST
jgi:tetratricopeptide (TPR) repeat protein